MLIGENIKAMRRRCGFTQEELAAQLSVTPQAVSKWENGNGMPDITQLVPLAQIFGITTDTLLGVVSAVYGTAHTKAAENHIRLLMSTAQSPAEKNLAAYSYLRAESEREPTNYTLMRLCINHAAEISRYVDFEGFLSDRPDERDEIFADCERKNACIARYCEDRANVEKSDYAMAWVYIHLKRFDRAKALIERLPSLESISLREHMESKLMLFQSGYEQAKTLVPGNLRKLLLATGTEFFNDFESSVWFGTCEESFALCRKMLAVLDAYSAFEGLQDAVTLGKLRLHKYLPRCYVAAGDMDSAEQELVSIAELRIQLAGTEWEQYDNGKELPDTAIGYVAEEAQREALKRSAGYAAAVEMLRALQ